jgi:ribosomal protein L37E
MSGMSADPPRSLLLASILKTMPFLQVHGFPRPAAFVFPLLTDLPLLGQAYVDMARGFVLKFYMILAALMNSLFVKLRTLTQGETKTEKKNRCGGVHFPQLREKVCSSCCFVYARPTGRTSSASDETETINIRVRVVAARNLPKMDKASCDCYVRVKLAGKEFQTKVSLSRPNDDFVWHAD